MHDMQLTWHGCYDGNWNGLITPDSFSHPAKMARGLTERIFDYAFERGWLHRGDVCVDPFGGIGSTGIIGASRGVKVLCCELEQRFVDLAKANFELHRRTWEACGDPLPVIVQGDSRRLCEVLGPALADACIGSPPFAETTHSDWHLSSSPDRLDKMHANYKAGGGGMTRDQFEASCRKRQDGYGTTDGQLGAMRAGDVAAVIGSPPFTESLSLDRPNPAERRRIARERNISNAEHVSPIEMEKLGLRHEGDYGATQGQLGAMPTGSVDAVVSSPPYAESAVNDAQRTAASTGAYIKGVRSIGSETGGKNYGATPGNLGNLPAGDVAAIVSSPPFLGARSGTTASTETAGGGPCAERVHTAADGDRLGNTSGQLAAMPPGDVADAIVSSPPYEGKPLHGGTEGNRDGNVLAKWCNETGRNANAPSRQQFYDVYGKTEGQVGELQGTTFWEASAIIVQQCFQILRPGGIAIFVCKDFVRNKARVPFSADWQRLCIACGFEPVEWIKASLVKEQRHPGLFGDEIVERTERKGFFRRLAEKKGSPKIDEEDVLILRKS